MGSFGLIMESNTSETNNGFLKFQIVAYDTGHQSMAQCKTAVMHRSHCIFAESRRNTVRRNKPSIKQIKCDKYTRRQQGSLTCGMKYTEKELWLVRATM